MWTSRASTREEIINQREPRPHFFHLLSTTGCPRNNRITFRVLITRYREELGLRATECAVKRLSSHVTRRIPITKSSRDKSFVSFPALTRCYSGSTVLTVRWIHQIFRIAVPSVPYIIKITPRYFKNRIVPVIDHDSLYLRNLLFLKKRKRKRKYRFFILKVQIYSELYRNIFRKRWTKSISKKKLYVL